MAIIQIEIPDADVQRVLNAFAGIYGWVDVETSGTKAAFAKRQVARFVKRTTIEYERNEASLAAQRAVVEPADINVT